MTWDIHGVLISDGDGVPLLGQLTMVGSIPVTLASDQSAVAITAAALPLPAGAATEATLATRASEATLATRASEATLAAIAVGLAASLDTTLSSRASEATLSSVLGQLDVALSTRASEATLVGVLTTTAFEARINTLGQKTMANSTPIVIASDQTAVPVSGTVTATISAIGSTGAAVPATAIQIGASDGTNLQAPRVYDTDSGGGTQYTMGANLRRSAAGGSAELLGQATMALSLPVTIASDQTTFPVTISAIGSTGSAVPATAIQIGGSDGTNLRAPRIYDIDTGGGTEYALGVNLRLSANGGGSSEEAKGQKSMTQSIPVVIASNQSAVPVNARLVWIDDTTATQNTTVFEPLPRGDSLGSQRNTSEVLLWHDAFEGSTINPFWTQSLTTMTAVQGSGVLTLNNAAITTLNTRAIITSQRQYPVYPRQSLACRFRALITANPAGASNHTFVEYGLGAPSGGTAIISFGAFFRWKTDGTLVCVVSSAGSESVSAMWGQGVVSTSNYYNYDVVLFDDHARFFVTDSFGTLAFATYIPAPITSPSTLGGTVSHTPSFARVYTDGTGGGTAIQLKIAQHSVQLLDAQIADSLEDRAALAMRHASIGPMDYVQTTQLASGAAPGAFTPSNTAAGNAFLGGEAAVNSTATNENLLSIFAYSIPTQYSFVLNGIFIPRPIITTALAATACILEFFLISNCASGNISTGNGQRISLGLYRAAASAAAATALDGSDINQRFATPIVCLPGTVLHIGWKMILGAATGVIRVVVTPDGYFM